MIAIIDYDAGNLKSVEKALLRLGEEAVVSRERETILEADKVILPGVGSFGDAMGKLREFGLDKVIYEVVEKGTPFLGICLGLQLLFERSDEAPGVKGLGILKGEILRIPAYEGLASFCRAAAKSVCVFCTFLLSEGGGRGYRKGFYLVQH